MKQFKLFDYISRFCFSIEGYDSKSRRPAFKFSDPVSNRRIWDNHKSGKGFELGDDLPQESSDLYCFSL